MAPRVTILRPSGRHPDELRQVRINTAFTSAPHGSVLMEMGDTRVLCTVSISAGVPRFMKGQGRGWLTAEYSMLPGATRERSQRDATRGRPHGRSIEIQRLIGRSLRAALALPALGERTLQVDCDVLQADGGTRAASITGAWVAMQQALTSVGLAERALAHRVAAVSVGIYQGEPVLDLDYAEDHVAEADLNLVMTAKGQVIEVQGTAEDAPFEMAMLSKLLALGKTGIEELTELQGKALGTL